MITSEFLNFLYELSQNNNREWFDKNKKRFEGTVKKPFEQFVAAVIRRIQAFEPHFQITPKESIFRIYRDTRFSNDKTPYKTHMAAVFTAQGRKTTEEWVYPGYYLQISYGSLNLGGGAYFLDKEMLSKVRQAIAQDPAGFHHVIDDPNFTGKYGALRGERNKILPPEFKSAALHEPLLYQKQFYFMAELDPEHVLGPDSVEFIGQYFEAAKPVNAFFRQALGSAV